MKLVLIGPPGCGKGTQAVLIRDKYCIPQVSTGDILRSEVRGGTELGKKAESYMNVGKLVPNELIIELMSRRIEAPDCSNGYILDGFPRTLKQAEALDEMLAGKGLNLDLVISIEVDDEEVVARLSGRRQCSKCGEGYHVIFKKPQKDGICNKCKGHLYQRDDDKEETIRARLSVYRAETAPLLAYYEERGLLGSVDGMGSIEGIFDRISSLIKKIAANN